MPPLSRHCVKEGGLQSYEMHMWYRVLTVEILNHVNQIDEDEDLAVTIVAMEMAERQEDEIARGGSTAEATPARQAQRTRRDFEDTAMMIPVREMAAEQEAENEHDQVRNLELATSPVKLQNQQSSAQDLQSPRSFMSRSKRPIRPVISTMSAGQSRAGREERPEKDPRSIQG
ncbi:hypothetical protein N7523_010564 [Penicillium sp. IBT 18751x]|nr:hypothetical protein N7523_010564 [Penicillium sp. IBT 18751x]